MKRNYESIAIHVPEIMLPAYGIDYCKWSVVACDQYTSEPAYWDDVKEITGDSPSTLRLTFPEIYLKDEDRDDRIKKINNTMEKYLQEGILVSQKPGFILLDRSTGHSPSRLGLIVALDLERYDYNKGSQSLIRATEGTVLDRIPPRVRIRQNAKIELPHIMVLIDDPEKTVIEPIANNRDNYQKIYDFELMKNGGHIKGWKIEDSESAAAVARALERLAAPEAFSKKYGIAPEKGVLLYAVGDGNHSLATAKAHWENIKKATGLSGSSEHPARYALVELLNLHDEGIIFEPIHRLLFGINGTSVIKELTGSFEGRPKTEVKFFESVQEMGTAKKEGTRKENIHIIPFILEGTYGMIKVHNPSHNLEVGTLQCALDKLMSTCSKRFEIDYIHGDEVINRLGSQKGNMGFFLPAMDKQELFKTVILEGALPRKTFSMGEAEEKRYYLECRKI